MVHPTGTRIHAVTSRSRLLRFVASILSSPVEVALGVVLVLLVLTLSLSVVP